MIVEMRTYDYRPGTVQKAIDRIAIGIDERVTLSPLGGLWQSQTGRLDRIVHLWPFRDSADRDAVRSRFGTLSNWPARTGEWMVASENKILIPAPFSPPPTPRRAGPVYEICTDNHLPGKLKDILAIWGEALAEPPPQFVGAWRTELGPMNQWVHIWAYASLEERARLRPGIVPGAAGDEGLAVLFASRESAIFSPAPYSPLL